MSWRLWNRRLSTSSGWWSTGSSASSCPSLSCDDSGSSSSSSESSSTSSSSLARSRPKTRSGVAMAAQAHAARSGTISSSQPTGPVTVRPSLEPRSVSQPAVVSLHAGRFIRELLPNRLALASPSSSSSRASAASSSSPARRVATLVMPSSSPGAPAVVVLDATPHPTPPATPRVPDVAHHRPPAANESAATLRVPDAPLPASRPHIPAPAPVTSTKRFYLSAETPQQSPDSTSSGTGTTASASGDLRPVPSDAHARDPAPTPSLSGPRNPSRSRSVDDGAVAASLTSATSSRSRVSAVSSARRTAAGKAKGPLAHVLSRPARSTLAPRKTATRAATLPVPSAAPATKHAGPVPASTKSGPGASSQRRGADADQSGPALPLAESPRQVTQTSILPPPAAPPPTTRPAASINPPHQAPTPPNTTASQESVPSGSRALPPPAAQSASQPTLNALPAQQRQPRNVFTGLLRPPKKKVELESSEEDEESSADDDEEDSWTEDEDGTAGKHTTAVRGQPNPNGRSVSVVDEAAQQLQREAEMFAKLPHRSWQSNLDRVQKVGLLTHLFRPDLVRSGLPHHSMSSQDLSSAAAAASARNQGQIPANQMRRPGALQPFTRVQPAVAQPTLAPMAPQQQQSQHPRTPTQQSPDRRQQQQQQQQQPPRQRGRPADQELSSDSEDDPDDAVQLSMSEAQQRLTELHRKSRHQQRTSPLQHELTEAQHPGPSNAHPNQYRYERRASPPPQAEPIPVLIDYALLPQPLPAVSPRTTRRNMMASEMSESLRHNLLRERQVAKRSLGVHHRNTSANQLPQLNDRGEPMSERELAGRQAILRNRSFQGPFTGGI